MNRFNLLPSVNWNISHMLVLNETGTICAYGSRGDVIILKNIQSNNLNEFSTTFIPRAHKNQRVMGLSFVKIEVDGELVESVASCGDGGRIQIWDIESGQNTHKCLIKKNSGIAQKLVDIDVFPQTNCIVSATETGSVIKWNVQLNKMWNYNVDPKITINCIAVCPHVDDLIAIGAHFGLVLIYSLKGEGKLRHRIRCHDNAVFSLSWCPVPYNALQLDKLKEDKNFDEEDWKKKDKTLLLASCSRDRSIYICKAGTDGYCEAVLTLPSKPFTNIPRYGNSTNNDRGRFIKWIYPSVLLTSTDFYEMITVYMFPNIRNDLKQKVKAPNVKFDIKPLHNIHKRMISNFAVHLNDSKEVDFRVWSCSADRILVRSGYKDNCKEKAVTLPLLSGYIFCLDVSPVNPDLLAIGTGDGKICIWNLSTDSYIDITTLSNKINGKVMSIRWHPIYEGVLAFGTYEGRVGMFDVSQGRTIPTLFKLFHNKPIYKLCWAPPVSLNLIDENKKEEYSKELYLFAVGNGDILQFTPSSANEVAISLNSDFLAPIEEACKCKHKSDLCYDSDGKCVAIGLSNGNVCICCAKTYKLWHTITEQPKAIMSMTWHPKMVYDYPDEESSCSNWLATAGESVFVYSIDFDGVNPPKKIASLEVHTNRVLAVTWSPHVNGRLLSCSADNTAIIWDVINQTIIGQYSAHCAQVLCGVWSPINKDVIITGSADFTCRMWSVSKDTNNKIIDSKKKPEKVIEPTILNASNLSDCSSCEVASTSFIKISKAQTILPTVSQEFRTCSLLEDVFAVAIAKHCGENSLNDDIQSSEETVCNDTLTQSDELNSDLEKDDLPIIMNRDVTSEKNNVKSDINYTQLFGIEDEFMKLVLHEEQTLESSGNLTESFVLSQSRFDLADKIKNAMSKNQVTEQILALAPSVSPKLWKEACQVYVEQMIQADNIFQAVNYLLALGKDDEAIDLLCEKNRFKDALALARLRTKNETVKNVIEKWIQYCYNCGLFRLGAHCYMFLEEEQSATTFLIKSKLFKDMVLAMKLMKYYQPSRAVELATECFKKHLLQLTAVDVEELFKEFPDIRFMKPWYLTLKYFRKEKPNTASITKWLLGMSNIEPDDLSFSKNIDHPKLREVVVDNTFNMNYEQLMIYVSAQTALYVSGISNIKYERSALRSYIRALFHCYNYKIVNSNQVQSDAAYPMMCLLKLMFPSGIFDNFNDDLELNDTFKLIYRSIKAYYCDFMVSWLINIDELPKSIRALEQKKEDPDADESEGDLSLEELKNRFAIIRDKKVKLRTLLDVLSLYSREVLDPDTVTYFKEMASLKQLESGKLPEEENISTKSSVDELNSSQNAFSKSQSSPVANGDVFKDEKENDESPIKNSDVTENGKHSGIECNSNEELNDVKALKASVELFEKERIAAPNPFVFYCMVKQFIEENKEVDLQLTGKLQKLIELDAVYCGI